MLDLLPEPSDIAQRWRRIVTSLGVRGKQAHDARLVVSMEAEHLDRILALNEADFARYPGVKCVTPAEVIGSN